MKKLDLVAKVGKDGNGGSFKGHVNLGENLKELVAQFGEEAIFSHAKASLVVAVQGAVRSKMTGKEPVTDHKKLQEYVDAWKPGTRKPGKPAAEKAKEALQKLSPEEKAALLKELAGKK